MFRIVIAPDKGGIHPFETREEAMNWAADQRVEFEELFGSLDAAKFAPEANQIQRAWIELEDIIRRAPAISRNGVEEIPGSKSLLMASSLAAQIIHDIAENRGASAMQGAMHEADIPVGDLDYTNIETFVGMHLYKEKLTAFRGAGVALDPTEMKQTIAEFREQIANLRARVRDAGRDFEKLTDAANSGISAANSSVATLNAQVETASSQVDALLLEAQKSLVDVHNEHNGLLSVNDERTRAVIASAESELEAWRKAQMEDVRLEAPVQLWAKRKMEHDASAGKLAIIAGLTGVAGTVATPFISKTAFNSARSMLADATQGIVQNPTTGIRPTLHFELIFAGVATLFWLTMFFWLMRILVRLYVSEQRLAVDAGGRAAMTQTYLGLIKEKGASEADRPIVLTALFQPLGVSTKTDDGPPATSLATIAASIVAGKN